MTATFSMKKLLSGVSMATAQASNAVGFQGVQASLSVTFAWADITGTKDGKFTVQVTNKPDPQTGDWEEKASYTLQGGDAATGQKTVNVDLIHEAQARVLFTPNAVAGGTLTAYATAKKKIG